MKIPFPKDSYLKAAEVIDGSLNVTFEKKKKIALMFICLNPTYWPYLAQVTKDCRLNFLPHHQVDYFVWTDYNAARAAEQLAGYDHLVQNWKDSTNKQAALNQLLDALVWTIRCLEPFYAKEIQALVNQLPQHGLGLKREGFKFWFSNEKPITEEIVAFLGNLGKQMYLFSQNDLNEVLKTFTINETDPVGWPAPTLMRYHLFLNEKEKLSGYDYLFYMDADMKVVSKISDEVLGPDLTAAPHPGYELASRFIPPYEPNPESTAYIPRLGRLVEENGKKRFMPFYAAGGFQGGKAKSFIKAMETMKKKIDIDFDHNYTAIWNDESHFNRYLWEYQQKGGHITFLDPSYVYPDSLIKEYYIPIWGRDYAPKIITLTKPFSLSSQGGEELQQMMK